jgi:hypothetical protein
MAVVMERIRRRVASLGLMVRPTRVAAAAAAAFLGLPRIIQVAQAALAA